LIDPGLEQFATDTQKTYLKAINEHGSHSKAAKALGVAKGTVGNAMCSLQKRAAGKGYAPSYDMTRPAPPGFNVKGTSTYYDEEGKVRGQWVKTTRDQAETEELLREFVQSLCQDIKPLPPIGAAPARADADLLAVYPQGDPHVGMMAWWKETGDNFDLDIAERLTQGAIDRLVASAPNAATAIFLGLGDLLHADNQKNVTNSGHQLDVDGRWKKCLQVALRTQVYAIRRLLEKHERVIARLNGGNHDGHVSYAVALMLDCFFHMEPRVEIDLSPAACWYHQFGSVLLGSTHGDTMKGADLISIMATDKPEAWGETKHRHWMVGHVHHRDLKEYRGGTVEYFRTLAARDAWHAGQGYRAGRDMTCIVYHREHGELERHRCDSAMIPV
jgi:hypothetical protein